MPLIKYIAILFYFMALIVAAETNTSFFVPEKRIAKFKKEYGERAGKRLSSLLALMDELVAAPEDKKVVSVNDFFNQIEYSSDMQTWNKKDYWASRLEFLGKGRGDCEDFAVAKFLTMMQLGVPSEKLFLTYVKAVGYPEAAHLVVTYYKKPGSIPFVIDNYNRKILLATKRKDLIPVYSFTADDLYLQKQHGLGKRINRASLKTQQNLKAIERNFEIRKKEK